MIKRFIFLLLSFCSFSAIAATWQINYARLDETLDHRATYPLAVLRMALEHTGVRYVLKPTRKVLLQGKAIKQLKANREVSLVWSMTDKEREEELLPIRIPIYKGLIGWRIFLVRQENRDLFETFTTIQELRQFAPVQGYDWPDTKILQANGFEVVTSNDYNSMFEIVRLDRANFFPRSIVEIWSEVDNELNEKSLVVESKMVLRYPTATYFFFNKKNKVLKNLVETGMRRAMESGEFDKLFYDVHQPYLDKADIQNRRVFELDNPVLPEETPVNSSEYWYKVGQQQTD